MKEVIFKRNTNKIERKKSIKLNNLKRNRSSLEDKIEQEYQIEYRKAIEQYKKAHGHEPIGIHACWLDEEMWYKYQSIKEKYLNSNKNKKEEMFLE